MESNFKNTVSSGNKIKALSRLLAIVCFSFIGAAQVWAQATTTVTFSSSGTWTPPAGVTSATVECWGGGGAGGGATNNNCAGGGGGGGGYARKLITGLTNTPYTVTVGAAVAGGTGNGTNGNPSWFSTVGTVYADFGRGGTRGITGATNGALGAGGTANIGDVVCNGGSGAAGVGTSVGGGGGGGAGSSGAGGPASGSTAGTGTANSGGAGSAGVSAANAAAASNFGGGGGGARRTTATNRSGGNGAAGFVRITYTLPPSALTVSPATATICSGTIQALTATGGTVTGANILDQDFNSATNDWTPSGSTGAGNAWTLQPSGYNRTETFSNNNSRFYISISDGTGGNTNYLRSPAFSTVGFTAATFNFKTYFRSAGTPGVSTIQISNDNTSWTDIPGSTFSAATVGTSSAFSAQSFALPAANLNQATVYIRFNYVGTNDWYWAVDDISITGTYQAPITWGPITELFVDAGATTAYTVAGYPNLATVYAKPTIARTYTATATNATLTSTNTSTITVETLAQAQPGTLNITSGVQSGTSVDICPTAAFTVTRTGGGGTAYYHIGDNTNALENWDFGAPTYGNTFTNTSLVLPGAGNYLIRCYAGNSCGLNYHISGSDYMNYSDVTINAKPLDPKSISSDQTICEGDTPASLSGGTPDNGTGSYTYNWMQSTDNGVTWTNASGTNTNATYSPPALTATTLYKRQVISSACNTQEGELIVWGVTSANVWTTNSSIKKYNTVTDAWDAGGISTQSISNQGGFVEALTEDNDRAQMVGLGNYDTDPSYTSIEFAGYSLLGQFQVYESGVYKGAFGVINRGDLIKVAVENNQVKYYVNNVLRYTSLVTPTFPLYGEVSVYSGGNAGAPVGGYGVCSGFKYVRVMNPVKITVNPVPAGSSWASSYGSCGAPDASISPTCGAKTLTVPNNSFTSVSMMSGRSYTFSSNTPAGWSTPKVVVYYSTNSGGTWNVGISGNNSVTYTAPANPGTSFYYLVTVWNGSPCSSGTSVNNATLTYQENSSSAPSVPGNGSNAWNFLGYETPSLDLTGVTFKGFYTVNTLSYNTTTDVTGFNNSGAPSYSTTWTGCNMDVNNHTLVAKRAGFPCGIYQLDVPTHDDGARIYLNGTLIWKHEGGCCDVHTNLQGGELAPSIGGGAATAYVWLGSSDVIEFRNAEGCGGSNQGITFTEQSALITALSGGTIDGITNNVSLCSVSDPGAFTNSASPAGGSPAVGLNAGSYTYQWQVSFNGGAYGNVVGGSGATSIAFDPNTATLASGAGTYDFRRMVTDTKCGTVAYSNVIRVYLYIGTPSTPVATAGTAVSFNTFTANWGSVAQAASYELDVSTDNTFATFVSGYQALNVGSVTTFAVTGLTQLTTYYYRVRAVNPCVTTTNSNTITVTTTAIVYCTPTGSSNASTYISNFTTSGAVTNISNASGAYSAAGYGNFYNTFSASQIQGGTFSFTTTLVGGTVGSAVWIDWNQNGVFEATERVFNTTAYGNGPYSATVTVPINAVPGATRMRVNVNYNASNPSNPCIAANTARGETEDYKFIVNPICPTLVNAGSDIAICPGANGSLTGSAVGSVVNSVTPAQQNVMGSTVTDVSNTEVSVTITGALAGATITSVTFTPRVRVVYYASALEEILGITTTTACFNYNSWVKLQYWNGSSWVDITNCNAPITITNFNGNTANGQVIKIRTVDTPDGADAVYTDLLNVTCNWTYTYPVSYAWSGGPIVSGATSASATVNPTSSTPYTLTATSNTCPVTDIVNVNMATATPASVATATGATLAPGDLLWCGLSSTAWGLNSNWYAYNGTDFVVPGIGVSPTASNRVFVLPNGTSGTCISASNNTTVAASGLAKDVFIGTGATMLINAGQSLQVNGDWTNNGTFTPDATATVEFAGGAAQTIGGSSANDFTNLTLNKSANTLTLNTPVNVSGTLTMTAGDIATTGANLLTVGTSPASPGSIAWTGGTVIGPLKRYFSGTASGSQASGILPVGLSGVNRYAQVNYTGGLSTGGSITAEYISGPCPVLYAGLPQVINGQMIQNYENEGYWSISPSGGDLNTATYSLILRGNTLSTVTSAPDMAALRLMKSVSHTSWDNTGIGSHSAPSGGVSDFTISNSGMTGFSFFNIGSGNANPLPVAMLDFAANCNDKSEVDVKWTTASEQNSESFIVERSRDLVSWEFVSTINAAGNSNYSIDYSANDTDPFSGVSYYHLVQVDNNGVETIYGPISVSCSDLVNMMQVFPNPTKGDFTVEISSDEDLSDSQLIITDLSGKVISTRRINVLQGKTQAVFENQELNLGTYIIHLNSLNHHIQPVRVVVN